MTKSVKTHPGRVDDPLRGKWRPDRNAVNCLLRALGYPTGDLERFQEKMLTPIKFVVLD